MINLLNIDPKRDRGRNGSEIKKLINMKKFEENKHFREKEGMKKTESCKIFENL